MTSGELGAMLYWTGVIIIAVMYLGDAVNSCTAAVRELIELTRKDKP